MTVRPCPVRMILVELQRGTKTNLAESGGLGLLIAMLGTCLLVEYWVTGGAGVVEYLLVHGFLSVPGSKLVRILWRSCCALASNSLGMNGF